MTMVEIDETQLAANTQLRDYVAKLMSKPESRRKMQEAQKLLNPDTVIPELDAAQPVLQAVQAVEKRFDDYRKEQEEKETKRTKDEQDNALKGKWSRGQSAAEQAGYKGDGLKKLEEFMQEKGIFDHELAIPAFERIHPPAQAAIPNGSMGQWNFFEQPKEDEGGDKFMKAMMESKGEDDSALRAVINQTLSDDRSGRRAA